MKITGLPAFVAVLAVATVLTSPPLPGVALNDARAQTPVPTPTATVPPAPEEPEVPEPPPPPPAPPAPGQGGGNDGGSGVAPPPPPVTAGGGGPSRGGGRGDGGGSGTRHPRPAPPGPTVATTIWWGHRPSFSGLYTTSQLMGLVGRVKGAGPSAYAPFIIAGRASFSDTFGGIRRSSDTGLRPHLGQDVFCDYGAPVLASEHGWIDHGSDAAGGLVARLHRSGGSYWYYAHLSRFSTISSGSKVEPGDVIGYCGTSGNAAGTPPHVHFGLYSGGVAQNPMGALIGWLNEAERNAARLESKKKAPRERGRTKKERKPQPRRRPALVCPKREGSPDTDVLVTELLVLEPETDLSLAGRLVVGVGAAGPLRGRSSSHPKRVATYRVALDSPDTRPGVERHVHPEPQGTLEDLLFLN